MRHAGIVLAAMLCLSIFGYAQSADELVNKNIQAKGGLDKIKAIKTVRITGKLSGGGGFTAAMGQENQRPNLVRETFSLQGMTAVTAYDGATGWQIQPFGGHKDPEFMGEDDLKDLLLDADFDGPLVDYKEKGHNAELVGHDSVEGTDCFKVKLSMKNGDVRYYYLDADSFLELKLEIQTTIRGALQETEIYYGDYEKVNGVYYPFSVEQAPKGSSSRSQISVEKVEQNVPLDDARFSVPSSKPEAKASPAGS